ncbi:hypothetical protein [Achromobacter sp. UMC46]|uniref:hypothetical protein n=1 Tax=Achromobacter sp. UMC46 TaxID=1862319 RepID=UPI0015FFEF1B|nr:hypothetical protein [Achromobacter sp. UMC46]
MALDLDEQDGQTPLDPDERAGLIPEHLNTKGELNDWEQENILRAVRWLKRTRPPFSCGGSSLVSASQIRSCYLEGLRAADKNDYQPLLAFVRS